MSRTLKELWEEMVNVGYKIRKQRENGLVSWQPYKKLYASAIIIGYEEGIPLKKSFMDLSESLPYFYEDEEHNDAQMVVEGVRLDNQIETNHFFIQHFRIPKLGKYKLPVLKLLQIAYNAGQLRAVFEENFEKSIKDFYGNNNLGDITTYVEDDIINKEVNIVQAGASYYYYKYLTYKNKYLFLKRKYQM